MTAPELQIEQLHKIVPCAKASKVGLVFSGEETVEELDEGFIGLATIETVGAWWWGDFLAEIYRRSDIDIARYDVLAEVYGISIPYLQRCLTTAFTIPIQYRLENISFTHHFTILVELKSAGRIKVAPGRTLDKAEIALVREWLTNIKKDDLSVSATRRAIRQTYRHISKKPSGAVTTVASLSLEFRRISNLAQDHEDKVRVAEDAWPIAEYVITTLPREEVAERLKKVL